MTPRTVVLTHDTATHTTRVEETGRQPVTVLEPDHLAGACVAGTMYATNGYDVTIRKTGGRA